MRDSFVKAVLLQIANFLLAFANIVYLLSSEEDLNSYTASAKAFPVQWSCFVLLHTVYA